MKAKIVKSRLEKSKNIDARNFIDIYIDKVKTESRKSKIGKLGVL